MSDNSSPASETGYETPVPELDDHRHQTSSVLRTDRPRRDTFDSLYGQHFGLEGPARGEGRGRNMEEAVIDEDGDVSPTAYRSRRPTMATTDRRSVSPPNSVKAFAEARRRERTLSFSDPAPDKTERNDDHDALHRTMSVASRHSHLSRPYTVENDNASISTRKSAEEDVCYPLQEEHTDDQLHIDFEYLESFMRAQEELRAASHEDGVRVFTDLRPESTPEKPVQEMVTSEGDFVSVPARYTGTGGEKPSSHETKEASKPTAPPTDPNRFSFFSSAWESTIHAADFLDLVLPGEDIRGLFTLPKDTKDGVWWLNMNNPSEDEVRAICRAFGIHPLTIEDITTQEAREKIELFPSYYFASFRSFNTVVGEAGEVEYEPFHLYVAVFREGTLSFSFKPNAHASNVRKRIAMLKNYVALSSDWICYALIDNIVDTFGPVISKVEMDAEMIEDEVFVARATDHRLFLQQIGSSRKNVLSLMRLLGGKADVLRGFTKRCNENYKVTPRMDIGLYLGDIQDHVVTMMNNLTHCEKILTRAHSNYLAQLSVDNIMETTATNEKLNRMTLIASVIVPLNVITGLFGMNVMVPFQDNANLGPWFGILGVLVLFVLVCVYIARSKRWW